MTAAAIAEPCQVCGKPVRLRGRRWYAEGATLAGDAWEHLEPGAEGHEAVPRSCATVSLAASCFRCGEPAEHRVTLPNGIALDLCKGDAKFALFLIWACEARGKFYLRGDDEEAG